MESDIQALFEYMANGDLRDYLVDPSHPREWTGEKWQIAIDVIEALVYVHSLPLVHRDLKSRNVLLSESMEAKLTDFGVSRFKSENETMTGGVGTGRWQAPEVLTGRRDYDQAADIFSFGVVLSELDTHAIPYEEVRAANGSKLADVAIVHMVASGAVRPHFNFECPQEIRALADRCLALNPRERPAAPEIAYVLRSAQKSMNTKQL